MGEVQGSVLVGWLHLFPVTLEQVQWADKSRYGGLVLVRSTTSVIGALIKGLISQFMLILPSTSCFCFLLYTVHPSLPTLISLSLFLLFFIIAPSFFKRVLSSSLTLLFPLISHLKYGVALTCLKRQKFKLWFPIKGRKMCNIVKNRRKNWRIGGSGLGQNERCLI